MKERVRPTTTAGGVARTKQAREEKSASNTTTKPLPREVIPRKKRSQSETEKKSDHSERYGDLGGTPDRPPWQGPEPCRGNRDGLHRGPRPLGHHDAVRFPRQSPELGPDGRVRGPATRPGGAHPPGVRGLHLAPLPRGRPDTGGARICRILVPAGLNPVEFSFHAMGGREGLVDTPPARARAGTSSGAS